MREKDGERERAKIHSHWAAAWGIPASPGSRDFAPVILFLSSFLIHRSSFIVLRHSIQLSAPPPPRRCFSIFPPFCSYFLLSQLIITNHQPWPNHPYVLSSTIAIQLYPELTLTLQPRNPSRHESRTF